MDLLVIRLRKDAVLENEIGSIFRGYNICEFKSPGDGLNIDDYFKTLGYACFYKSGGRRANAIPAGEVTVSFLRNEYPRGLVRSLQSELGLAVSERYPGIYYLEGAGWGRSLLPFPVQLIVSEQLEKHTHSALRVLTRHALEEDVRRFLSAAARTSEQGDRQNIDSLLQVSVSANAELYEKVRRDRAMCEALRELMRDEIAQYQAESLEEGLAKGRAEGQIVSAVQIYRDEMGMDEGSILRRIMEKFNLSDAEAGKYMAAVKG